MTPVTRASLIAQAAEVGITEAQFNKMTIPQKTAFLHSAAYGIAATSLAKMYDKQFELYDAQLKALEQSIIT